MSRDRHWLRRHYGLSRDRHWLRLHYGDCSRNSIRNGVCRHRLRLFGRRRDWLNWNGSGLLRIEQGRIHSIILTTYVEIHAVQLDNAERVIWGRGNPRFFTPSLPPKNLPFPPSLLHKHVLSYRQCVCPSSCFFFSFLLLHAMKRRVGGRTSCVMHRVW